MVATDCVAVDWFLASRCTWLYGGKWGFTTNLFVIVLSLSDLRSCTWFVWKMPTCQQTNRSVLKLKSAIQTGNQDHSCSNKLVL